MVCVPVPFVLIKPVFPQKLVAILSHTVEDEEPHHSTEPFGKEVLEW
jgi:hypothetical protein